MHMRTSLISLCFVNVSRDFHTFSLTKGFYCTLESDTATPSGTGGDVCPVGHYCPEGSDAAIPRPTGYYLDVQQQDEESDCQECPLGEYYVIMWWPY